jgi:DNA-binding transcriptional LysR family regulator
MPRPLEQWLGVELRHLATFHAVAEEESFSRAAARLGYTQSAVSHQIAALERIVGVRLIDRPGGPKRVTLTKHGMLLRRHADRLLTALSAAEADMRQSLDGESTLRVGTFQSVSTKALPSIMKLFAREFPDTTIELTEAASDCDLLSSVAVGDLELAFAGLPLEEGPFDFVELLEDPYVLLVPAESELAARDEPLRLDQLARIPLISFQQCRKIAQLEESMRARGLKPRFVYRSDDNGTIQAMVAAGMGAALLPRLALQPDEVGVSIVELAVSVPPRIIVVAWHHDRSLSAASKRFVEISQLVCGTLTHHDSHGIVAADRA